MLSGFFNVNFILMKYFKLVKFKNKYQKQHFIGGYWILLGFTFVQPQPTLKLNVQF